MKTESKEFMGMKFYRYILEQDLDVDHYHEQDPLEFSHTEVIPEGSVSGWISENSVVDDDAWVYEDSIVINSHIFQSDSPIKGSVIVNSQVVRSGSIIDSTVIGSYIYKIGGMARCNVKSSVIMYKAQYAVNDETHINKCYDGNDYSEVDSEYLKKKLEYTPWWRSPISEITNQMMTDEEIDELVKLIKADNSK